MEQADSDCNVVAFCDEASMCPQDVFRVCHELRKGSKIVLVLSGQFNQLPPVVEGQPAGQDPVYAFLGAEWQSSDVKVHYLGEFVRGMEEMGPVLQRMSESAVTEADAKLLQGLAFDPLDVNSGFQETDDDVMYLYAKREAVNAHNKRMHALLDATEYEMPWLFNSTLKNAHPVDWQEVCQT